MLSDSQRKRKVAIQQRNIHMAAQSDLLKRTLQKVGPSSKDSAQPQVQNLTNGPGKLVKSVKVWWAEVTSSPPHDTLKQMES